MDGDGGGYSKPVEIQDGPFKGWITWGEGADPFETANGPFCFREEADGRIRSAFIPRREHLNGGGFIHGGALMSFADFSLFSIASKALADSLAVTLTFNAEFISAGDLDGMVESHGEVVRNGRSVIFVRGTVTQRGEPLLAFSASLKKIARK